MVTELSRTDSIENMLTCLICLDIVFNPVTASCNHSFCMACIKRLIEFEGERVSVSELLYLEGQVDN